MLCEACKYGVFVEKFFLCVVLPRRGCARHRMTPVCKYKKETGGGGFAGRRIQAVSSSFVVYSTYDSARAEFRVFQ
jgi:hypothetical protein